MPSSPSDLARRVVMPPKPPARRGYSMAPAGAPEGEQRRWIAERARTHAKKTSHAWNCGRPSSATISSYDFEALSVFALARHLPAQGCNVTDEADGQQPQRLRFEPWLRVVYLRCDPAKD